MPVSFVLTGRVINSVGSNPTDTQRLIDRVDQACLFMVYLAIVAIFASSLEVIPWMVTGTRQANRVRARYLAAVSSQDIPFFDGQPGGALMHALNEDMVALQNAMGEKNGTMLHYLSNFVSGVAVACVYAWDLTLVVIALIPLLAAVTAAFAVLAGRLNRQANKAYAECNGVATEAFAAVRTVYSFNGEGPIVQRYQGLLKQPLRAGHRIGLLWLVVLGSFALALWYGGVRVRDHAYQGGNVITALFASLLAGFALGQASPIIQFFVAGKAAGNRVFAVIHRQPATLHTAAASSPTAAPVVCQGSLVLQGVTFAYPSALDQPVLRDFSLSVPAGKMVALVGQSGSGKSTIVSLIERFYDVQAGQVCTAAYVQKAAALCCQFWCNLNGLIGRSHSFLLHMLVQVLLDGTDIPKLPRGWLRQQMGLVAQEPVLFGSTIADNIRQGREGASQADVEAAAEAASAHGFITALPLAYDISVGEDGVQLSGGQKQRIAIARAILRNPQILLLDEATAALDSNSERLVQQALDALMAARHRTTIVVAHRLSTIMNADIIAVMKHGQVVEQGSHAELMRRPGGAYAALIKLQAAARRGDNQAAFVEPEDDSPHQMSHKVSQPNSHQIQLSVPERLEDVLSSAVLDTKLLNSQVIDDAAPPADSESHALNISQPPVPVAVDRPQSSVQSDRCHTSRPSQSFVVNQHVLDSCVLDSQVDLLQSAPELIQPVPAAVGAAVAPTALRTELPGRVCRRDRPRRVSKPQAAKQQQAQIRKYCAISASVGGAALVCGALQQGCFAIMGQKLARRLRITLMSAILSQEIAWFDQPENSSGTIAGRLATDTLHIRGAMGDVLGLISQNFVTVLAAFIIAFTAGWRMTLVVLATLPLTVAAYGVQSRFLIGFSAQADNHYLMVTAPHAEQHFQVANAVAARAISSIRTIAAFGLQPDICALYAQHLKAPSKRIQSSAISAGVAFGVANCVTYAVNALAFWYGGHQVASGRMSLTDMLKVFFSIVLAAMGAGRAQMSFPDVAKVGSAMKSVFGILDARPAASQTGGSGKQPQLEGRVELRNVSFHYPARPEVQVFREFNLSIEPGRVLALVGQSGSGKSTIIALLLGFYRAEEGGQVLFDGTDIDELDIKHVRDQIGLVSQEPVLFSGRCAEAAFLCLSHVPITHTGLVGGNEHVGSGEILLSGGQKQRVAIARAIIKDPKVLLLDEATSALDAESEQLVQQALDRLMQGRTTVVVAHRLNTTQSLVS
eukprot:jgi/Astpho2/5017/Aster-05951